MSDLDQLAEAVNAAGLKLKRALWNLEARRKAARFRPDGKLKPALSDNRHIHDQALIREPIGDKGAELWITYSGSRKEALRMRDDPALREMLPYTFELIDPDAL